MLSVKESQLRNEEFDRGEGIGRVVSKRKANPLKDGIVPLRYAELLS